MSQSRKDQIKSCLMRNVAKLKVPVTIGKYYGRLGNNVQQIALAILYGELHLTGVIIPEHSLIEGFRVNVPRLWPRQFALRNRFYYYHEPDGFPSDIELDYPHSLKNIRRIAHKHIFPNLKLKAVVPLPDDVLVIHLRGGDIFETTKAIQDNYIQNPLSYYTGLIEKFERTIVVTEPGMKNPLVAILRDLGAVTIQSSTVEDDFSVLLSARNLASSGVGTFAVAAALCSQNIIRFFHSDVYGTGHLNPEMLHGIETYCIPLGENYIKPGEWIPNERIFEIMQNYQVDRAHFNNI